MERGHESSWMIKFVKQMHMVDPEPQKGCL